MMSSYTYTKKILRIPISRHQHEIGYEGRYEYLLTYSNASFYVFTSTLVPEIVRIKILRYGCEMYYRDSYEHLIQYFVMAKHEQRIFAELYNQTG
jgi:hypothetical protein